MLLGAVGGGASLLPPARDGLVESGVPAFVVLGPESIGLSSVPTDLQLLPDGRVLVVSQQEIAFGDGVRWETYRGVGGPASFLASRVAVDQDGRIYAGTNGQIARIELTPDAHWQLVTATAVPADETMPNAAMTNVAVFPNMWYWYGGSGAVLAWRPGQEPRIIGHVAAIDRIMTLGEQVFVSSQASGDLFQLGRDGSTLRVSPEGTLVNESVTCSAPFAPGQLLVGTNGRGLKIFDGTTFRPFRTRGLLDSGRRINDVCPTGNGYFAAAVDTVGIAFFDRDGRIVQVLDRLLDHRLARVQRLAYAPTGVLWALLNDGIARIEFPSPVSHFEPLVASSLAYARPLRHNGQLWLMADGRAMRGIYDAAGRLERFELDMPPGRYLFTLQDVDGQLFGANDAGIFVREESGWRSVAAGIANARVGVASTAQGLLYVARNEVGWIKRTPRGYDVRRIPQAGLGNTYNAITDPAGIVWLEMGTSRVGRIDPRQENPKVELFGTSDGLVDGWVQIFVIDGAARFNMTSRLCRFDAGTRRFVPDRELLARYPLVTAWNGRPTADAAGRVWFTVNGVARHFKPAAGAVGPVETVPIGFETNEFTMEENGVVWMWGNQRLVRYDPRMPRPAAAAPKAMITSVQFAASNHRQFAPGASLGRLPFTDNSLVVYFAAPADPFGTPVTFEVMLEGAVTQWVSTGAVGSATFSRLKEGAYVFRVRPMIGDVPGAEARLAFTVQPPWYRTPLAWVLYVVGALGVVVGAAWLSSYLEHREKIRLERVVTERTRELNDINAQLGRQIAETTEKAAALVASEERFRALNTELEQRVEKRTAELSQRNAEIFQERRLLRTLIDNLPIAIYAKDTECRKTLANPADLKNMRGVATEADALGKTDFDLFPREDAARFFADDQAVLKSGQTVLDREESFLDAEGRKHWLLTSKLPLRNQAGAIIGLVGIGRDITLLKEAELKVEALHKQLLQASRTAGMAEVATGVLHNVGNVLNSVNVSAGVVAERLRDSRVSGVSRLARLLQEQNGNLARFFTEDERGRKVPEYLAQLAQTLEQERTDLGKELDGLILNIDHIKEIVAMQQNYARVLGVVEAVEMSELIEDAFKIHGGAYVRHGITVEKNYAKVPSLTVDKHAVLQILVNLLHNAKYACDASNRPDKRVTVGIAPAGPGRVKVQVGDNGIGIASENLARIFSQGFTTRKGGHGFGLHSGALAAKQLGGTLTVHSDGEGRGATFTLELPCQPPPAEPKKQA